jgi:MFS family permease
MTGWMLPLSVLRSVTPAAQVAWRTSLYRVVVDGGMALGPLLAGALADRYGDVLPITMILVLAGLALALAAGWRRIVARR